MGSIKNGKDTPLSENFGNLPDMSSSMLSWFRPMIFVKLTKTVVNHKVNEAEELLEFRGTWQPQSQSQINMKPIGQRSWRWFSVHCEPSLVLENDEIIIYKEKRYRVQGNTDYSEYGYLEYSLVEDYE